MTNTQIALAAAAAALCLAGQADARPRYSERAPSAAAVSLTKVDFNDARSVKAFYLRLSIAARDVCDSRISDRAIKLEDAACRREAMDRAVSQISRPLLTARHEVKSQTGFARGY